ncbi:MAG: hypothetical protein MUC95_00005 [Spirochaetes bacterium]|jgi:hypothetical protein|nr:hypothetical protein [Spirochaetota bacterium]
MEHIRIWTKVDLAEIENKIVVIDDKFGFCPGCRELGIKLENLKKCPKCGREFLYMTSREAKGTGKAHIFVTRAIKKLPHLTFVDYDDYEQATSKKKAENLFSV